MKLIWLLLLFINIISYTSLASAYRVTPSCQHVKSLVRAARASVQSTVRDLVLLANECKQIHEKSLHNADMSATEKWKIFYFLRAFKVIFGTQDIVDFDNFDIFHQEDYQYLLKNLWPHFYETFYKDLENFRHWAEHIQCGEASFSDLRAIRTSTSFRYTVFDKFVQQTTAQSRTKPCDSSGSFLSTIERFKPPTSQGTSYAFLLCDPAISTPQNKWLSSILQERREIDVNIVLRTPAASLLIAALQKGPTMPPQGVTEYSKRKATTVAELRLLGINRHEEACSNPATLAWFALVGSFIRHGYHIKGAPSQNPNVDKEDNINSHDQFNYKWLNGWTNYFYMPPGTVQTNDCNNEWGPNYENQ